MSIVGLDFGVPATGSDPLPPPPIGSAPMTSDKSARRRTLVYFGALWGVAIVFMIVQALVQG